VAVTQQKGYLAVDDDDHEPGPTFYEFVQSLGSSLLSAVDHCGDLMIRAWFYPARVKRSRHYKPRHDGTQVRVA
jgi:hypothetical protein